MDKLLQIAYQPASDTTSSSTVSMAVSPEKFNGFMKQNLIWNFYEMSKGHYMAMSESEILRLIDGYYKHMNDGKSNFNFRSCLICLRMLTLGY